MSEKPKLLLVDDDDFIQLVIGENLAKLGYEVDIAHDGRAAWEKISLDPKGYDLVLLDKMMPGMDGITLLKRIRADSRMTGLPVVMLTGADKPEDIVEGLAAGAYYYLVKPATQDVLSRVVKSALEESLRKRELQERIGQQRNNLRLLQRAVFSFRTLKEAKDLALLLSEVSMSPERTVSGYSELLINAVEHGNLGITYAEKGRLLSEDRWADEIEQRQLSPQYSNQKVEVVMDKGPDTFTVTITDQGQGFDWKKYLDFDPARAFDLHGRGIAMSSGLSFDHLEYLGKGNSVVTTVKLKN
ncbi:MAG TPA: response regulator [Gallionellaceae bacterium]|nr:response regulator [Gallionellaceae bacterium]